MSEADVPPEVRALVDELGREVRASTAVVRLAETGLQQVVAQFDNVPIYPENPDPTVMVGPGDPNDPASKPIGDMRLSQFRRLAQRRGDGAALLERQWIVSTYSRWDHYYRPALARAAGVPLDWVRSDLFGDLRLLRNDVVHNNSVASASQAGRCKLLTTPPPGTPIRITDEDFILIVANILVTICDPNTA